MWQVGKLFVVEEEEKRESKGPGIDCRWGPPFIRIWTALEPLGNRQPVAPNKLGTNCILLK